MTRSPTRIDGVPGVKYAMPLIEGQVLASGNVGAGTGALVRGMRGEDLAQDRAGRRQHPARARSTASTPAKASRSASAWPTISASSLGDTITLISPEGDVTPLGTTPRVKAYPVVGDLRGRHVGI